jgi:hypothetical protein
MSSQWVSGYFCLVRPHELVRDPEGEKKLTLKGDHHIDNYLARNYRFRVNLQSKAGYLVSPRSDRVAFPASFQLVWFFPPLPTGSQSMPRCRHAVLAKTLSRFRVLPPFFLSLLFPSSSSFLLLQLLFRASVGHVQEGVESPSAMYVGSIVDATCSRGLGLSAGVWKGGFH